MSWTHIWRHGNGHRFSALRDFISSWFGDVGPDDGLVVDRPSGLPEALVEFYEWVGRRHDLLRQHHVLLSPEFIEPDDDYTVFWASRGGEFSWAFETGECDDEPEVWMDVRSLHRDETWVCVSSRMSRFLTQMVLVEVAMAVGRFGGTAVAPVAKRVDFRPMYAPLDFDVWPRLVHQAFGNDDTLIVENEAGRFYVAARDRDAWRKVLANFEGRGFEWEVEWSD